MTTRAEAFAAQAAADLDVYDLLAKSGLPSSHCLHYLQMWLEKLCKAYLQNLPVTVTHPLPRPTLGVTVRRAAGVSRETVGLVK